MPDLSPIIASVLNYLILAAVVAGVGWGTGRWQAQKAARTQAAALLAAQEVEAKRLEVARAEAADKVPKLEEQLIAMNATLVTLGVTLKEILAAQTLAVSTATAQQTQLSQMVKTLTDIRNTIRRHAERLTTLEDKAKI